MGRTYEEGKKIRKRDGLKAIVTLLRYRSWRAEKPSLAALTSKSSLAQREMPTLAAGKSQ
jgi:hypothetical protein